MAIISKAESYCLGEKFKHVVKVDSKGVFSCNLPLIVTKTLGISELVAGSLGELRKKYADTVKELERATTTERKVIIYNYRASACIYRNDELVLRVDGLSFCRGIGVSLAAAVFIEKTTNELRSYHEEPSSIPESASHAGELAESYPSKNSCHGTLIEWSEKAEAFFSKVCIAMEELAIQMDALGKKNEVLNLIESGAHLRLPG